MLPRKRRLTTELLETVMEKGRMFHSPILSLKAIKVVKVMDPSDKSRFAAVASKKYFKTAVERNTVRRRTYEALRAILPKFDKSSISPVSAGHVFHCALMMKPAVRDMSQKELVSAIEDIFVKSAIIT